MPLREISNNAQSLPRGAKAKAKAKQTTKNPWTRNRHQLPLLLASSTSSTTTTTSTVPSSKTFHDASAFPPLPKVTKQQFIIHSEKEKVSVNREKDAEEEQTTPQPENVFFDTVQDWDTFLTEDISMWSTSPLFKQSDASICCLLCGKSIRGVAANEALVKKHVKGTHHKKTFQLMENLQTLKQQEPNRFNELIKAVMEPNNQPLPKCTAKQLLAYYHNVAIQARQSKKPLDGIATHFRRRFLNDKLQMCDTDNSTATESKTTPSLEKVDQVTSEVKPESSSSLVHSSGNTSRTNTQTNPDVGNEENVFGLVVRSPLARNAKTLQPSVDTPIPGASKPNQQDTPDSSTTTPVDKNKQESSKSTFASLGNKIENGACESPSSDISVQSEICWMASISELDDILSNRHDIIDGTLDENLIDEMMEEDVEETSGMIMPMMVVTRLETMEDLDVNSFLSSVEFDPPPKALPAVPECIEQTEMSGEDTHPAEISSKQNHVSVSTDVLVASPDETSSQEEQASITMDVPITSSAEASPKQKQCDAYSVASAEETEQRVKLQRSLECIAALAFVNM